MLHARRVSVSPQAAGPSDSSEARPLLQGVWRLWGRFQHDLRGNLSAESVYVLLMTPTFLALHVYLMKPRPFRRFFAEWRGHPYFEFYSFVWWYVGAGAMLCALPLVTSRVLVGRSWRDLGGGWGDRAAARPLALAFGVMVVVVIAVGFAPEFARKYPLCDLARTDVRLFVAYQAMYGLYFLAWEFFFRGWMLRGLAGDFGSGAIWIQTIPFALLHFGKPMPETLGAIPAGLFLGWIAWRSRSFLYGWLVHWGVAGALDTSIVLREWIQ